MSGVKPKIEAGWGEKLSTQNSSYPGGQLK